MAAKKVLPPKESKQKFYSPDGAYKTTVKKRYGEPERVKETRTIKGVIKKVPKPMPGSAPLIKEEPLRYAKKGGSTGDKNWIQKAVNPKHKGYCTPMSKPTCTPKRKALARTFKAMAKKR